MFRRVAYLTAIAGALAVAALLAGCAVSFMGEQRASWREEAENACMATRQPSAYVVEASEIDGRGACGISHPLKVSAFADGSVAVGPTALIGCPLTDAIDKWMTEAVQPAAIAWFGLPVVSIRQIDDYSCRSRNNVHGARISEHAFGNALDIAGFTLEDGHTILVRTGWRGGTAAERSFLREVEATACQRFSTVLGPGAPYHGDHFHVDLAFRKAGGSSYCNPRPQVSPPPRAPYTPLRTAGPVDGGRPAYTGSIAPAYPPLAGDPAEASTIPRN